MQVIVNYGSSWCAHCHELFPHFYDLAKKVSAWHMPRQIFGARVACKVLGMRGGNNA